MMTDRKIDCTASASETFRAVLLTFGGDAASDPRIKADTVATRLALLPRLEVVRHCLGDGADRIAGAIEDMVKSTPQALVIIAGAESLADARVVAVEYNYRFHNSPSIVFSAQEQITPMELIGGRWSFDLGVTDGDVDALCALIQAISERETEHSPIALHRLTNVLWRKDDKVLLGPAVVGTL